MEEEEEEKEEESPVVTPYPVDVYSCSSLIRLEQEAKREWHARVQREQRKGDAMPGKKISDEVLDLAEYTKNQPWWRKLCGPSSGSSTEKYNVATQLAIGGVTGWCTGFIFQKVGKLAATAVGGGFFLLQIANHTGYIKVDWQMVERDMSKAKEQLKFHSSSSTNQLGPEVKTKVDEVISFLKKNVLLTGGFVGGFLLGMAS
ncbi:FUN14 domain-containing protein 2 [Sphaerodactylus townsendi]|uniref:FUN14 domain-containing protein 2 n=1 Tax=Sphaerodactylus townsendi TaxID=933632 RepID=UPI00202695E7|nr:FUN14 domain-containing protein 2 [Sphaerodactylus townsendi]